MSGRLTEGFRDTIELRWSEFVANEKDPDTSNFATAITALVRACQKGNLRAIQTGLDRIDNKVATEIELDFPKFYTVYPQATMSADDPSIIDLTLALPAPTVTLVEAEEIVAVDEELPTGSLRAVLERMLDAPRSTVTNILGWAERVDAGDLSAGDPYVKSVIIAGLMKLVHDGKLGAVFEVFDQIDGKIAEKIKILGGDVYITDYSSIAPAGAYRNDKGIFELVASNTTNQWTSRLEQSNRKR